MPQVLSPRFHILQLGQSVHPSIPTKNRPVPFRHFRLVLAVAPIANWTGNAGAPTMASVLTIAGAAPRFIHVIFAHPPGPAADLTGHLSFTFARRKPDAVPSDWTPTLQFCSSYVFHAGFRLYRYFDDIV